MTVVAVVACGDEGPAAGTMTATVVSPNGDEGAAIVVLLGTGLGEATAIEGRVFSERRGDSLRVVVARDPAGTLRFAIDVEDVTRPPVGAVVEVAGPDDQLRTVLGGYDVEVR